MNYTRAHVFVKGRVQGVFFRAGTCEKANFLDLTGWVKNCRDGHVEAVFEGKSENVEKVLQWCKKGPPGAKVINVEVTLGQSTGEFNAFSILY
ncbi:MAG: acylphosphatase [Candidatus Scalindua sp.]|nr:acylphosphatase [Candidatus Scalindua sp.]